MHLLSVWQENRCIHGILVVRTCTYVLRIIKNDSLRGCRQPGTRARIYDGTQESPDLWGVRSFVVTHDSYRDALLLLEYQSSCIRANPNERNTNHRPVHHHILAQNLIRLDQPAETIMHICTTIQRLWSGTSTWPYRLQSV